MKNGLLMVTVRVGPVTLFVLLSLLMACGGGSTANPTATQAGSTSTAHTPEVPIILKLSTHNPPSETVSQTEQRWAEKVKQMSGGRLQFELYYSESLAKQTEIYRSLQTGVADIGYMVVGTDASQTPLSMMSRRTFMGLPSMKAASLIFWDLYNKYSEVKAEWKNMKVLTAMGLPPEQFFFVDKSVRLPKDMEGMKVIALGDYPAIMNSIKAVPVKLKASDWISGVEKRLVEGQVGIDFVAANSFKLLDYYNYVSDFGDGGAGMATEIHAINLDAWNSLPIDLQQILLDSTKWYEEEELDATTIDYDAGVRAGKDRNINFVKLTPHEIAEWQKVVFPLDEQFVADNASGGPYQVIYDDIKLLAQRYANVK